MTVAEYGEFLCFVNLLMFMWLLVLSWRVGKLWIEYRGG